MFETLFKSLTGISILAIALLVVQTLLAKFHRIPSDEDPLAGRLGCHGCGCESACKKDRG
ncbi:MAG: hypothetical protein AAGA03_01875 [Planctomycetota bacterium]